jgi:hypothetical protein
MQAMIYCRSETGSAAWQQIPVEVFSNTLKRTRGNPSDQRIAFTESA